MLSHVGEPCSTAVGALIVRLLREPHAAGESEVNSGSVGDEPLTGAKTLKELKEAVAAVRKARSS